MAIRAAMATAGVSRAAVCQRPAESKPDAIKTRDRVARAATAATSRQFDQVGAPARGCYFSLPPMVVLLPVEASIVGPAASSSAFSIAAVRRGIQVVEHYGPRAFMP